MLRQIAMLTLVSALAFSTPIRWPTVPQTGKGVGVDLV